MLVYFVCGMVVGGLVGIVFMAALSMSESDADPVE